MDAFKLVLCMALLLQQQWPLMGATSSPATASKTVAQQQPGDSSVRDGAAASMLGSLYRKSRQSRCVRCYEDRYADDRNRGYSSSYSSGGYSSGGYSSRSGDDRSNWYYPSERSSYDRYEDRYRGAERDYDRYYYEYNGYTRDRDDRYAPRTYDRYEGRGYDRYDDRRGSYDRGESRGYGYDNRDRYASADRYGDYYGSSKGADRYYEKPRGGSGSSRYGSGYDRDYYDRYYPSGQSGYDNSGRGYYSAPSSNGRPGLEDNQGSGRGDYNKRPSYYGPSNAGAQYPPQYGQSSRPCGVQVPNCPYAGDNSAGGGSSSSTVTSQTVYSSQPNGSGSSVINKNNDNSGKGQSWNNRDTNRDANSNGENRGDRNRDRDTQSSSYGGRPSRPLGGSYLLDRDSNVVSENDNNANAVDSNMPEKEPNNMADVAVAAALTSEAQANETTDKN